MKFVEEEASAIMSVRRVYRMGGTDMVVVCKVKKGLFLVGDRVYVASSYGVEDVCSIKGIAQFDRYFDGAPAGTRVQVTLDAPNVNVRRGDSLFRKEDMTDA